MFPDLSFLQFLSIFGPFWRQNNGHLASWMAGTERELREMKWLLNSSAARLDGQHRRGRKFSRVSFFLPGGETTCFFWEEVPKGRWIEWRLNKVNLCGKFRKMRKNWGWRVNLIAPTMLPDSYHIWLFVRNLSFMSRSDMLTLACIGFYRCLPLKGGTKQLHHVQWAMDGKQCCWSLTCKQIQGN